MGRRKNAKGPPPKFATSGDWHTHFIPFFDDQLVSPAYIALSANSKEVYTVLRMQYKGAFTGYAVKCPYSTFEDVHHMRRETVSRALDQLECYGFIEIDRGGLEHRPSVYKLSDKWKKLEDPDKLKDAEKKFADILERKKRAKVQKKFYKENHTG